MWWRWCAAVLIVSSPFAIPSAAHAAPPTEDRRAEAKTHFVRAVELYEEQDYRAALAEFIRANELSPSFKVLYNIGQTYFQLQDYPKALEAFEQYLERGARDVPAARRKEVEENRAKLRARIAHIEILTNVDARIAVDDEAVGAVSNGRSLELNLSAGTHVVSAQAAGYRLVRKSLTLVGEDKMRVELELEIDTPKTVTPAFVPSKATAPWALPQVPPEPPAKSRVPFFVALTATGVLAGGTIGFGVAALSSKAKLDGILAGPIDARATVDDAKKRLSTFTIVADAFGIATAVSGVVTIILAITTKAAWRSGIADKSKQQVRERQPSRWDLSLGAGTFTVQRGF
jgi:Tetratricopeptide repeat